MMTSGIYRITSPSGKMYVGSTLCFNKRWTAHRRLLKNGKHHCKGLQSACNKYGFDNLKFEKILVCAPDDLIFYEQRFIDAYWDEGLYNSCRAAGSTLGAKLSDECKRKISDSLIGNKRALGLKHSNVTKLKLSNTLRGMKKAPNSSGFTGVSYDKSCRKWVARMLVNGTRKILGYFSTPEEASDVYQNLLEQVKGEMR